MWSDEFDGPRGAGPDPRWWHVQTGDGGWGNDERQTYTAAALALNGEGSLHVTATIDDSAASEDRYTSGRMTSHGLVSVEYGVLQARMQLPEGPGLLPAFWLLGDDLDEVGWPASGEIDVVEVPHSPYRTEHHMNSPSLVSDEHVPLGAQVRHAEPVTGEYRIFTLEKRPGRIILGIDGETVSDVRVEDLPEDAVWVYDKPFHILFSLAIGGRWPGDPTDQTARVSTMSIDWVRLFELPEVRQELPCAPSATIGAGDPPVLD